MFNRNYIFKVSIFQPAMLVYRRVRGFFCIFQASIHVNFQHDIEISLISDGFQSTYDTSQTHRGFGAVSHPELNLATYPKYIHLLFAETSRWTITANAPENKGHPKIWNLGIPTIHFKLLLGGGFNPSEKY